jgi:hypothetical protein
MASTELKSLILEMDGNKYTSLIKQNFLYRYLVCQ